MRVCVGGVCVWKCRFVCVEGGGVLNGGKGGQGMRMEVFGWCLAVVQGGQ